MGALEFWERNWRRNKKMQEQIKVWSDEQCRDRIKAALARGEDMIAFFSKAADWTKEESFMSGQQGKQATACFDRIANIWTNEFEDAWRRTTQAPQPELFF